MTYNPRRPGAGPCRRCKVPTAYSEMAEHKERRSDRRLVLCRTCADHLRGIRWIV